MTVRRILHIPVCKGCSDSHMNIVTPVHIWISVYYLETVIVKLTLVIQSFVYAHRPTGDEEIFLQDFLFILKRTLQNKQEILKKCFLDTTCVMISSATPPYVTRIDRVVSVGSHLLTVSSFSTFIPSRFLDRTWTWSADFLISSRASLKKY